jgi:hypothetical protein
MHGLELVLGAINRFQIASAYIGHPKNPLRNHLQEIISEFNKKYKDIIL